MKKILNRSRIKSVPIIVQSEGAISTGSILTRPNYDIWSQLMDMHIAKREKLPYIHGEIKSSIETNYGYEKWYVKNQKVKRWLLMLMISDIMKCYLRLPTI